MSDNTTNISRPPRKWLSAQQKLAIVNESFETTETVAIIARKHNVGVSSLIKWRKQVMNGGFMSIKNNDEKLVPASELKKQEKRIRELERMLGKKTMQIALLQDAIELAREKKFISRQPLPGVDYSVDD
jgi:transposase